MGYSLRTAATAAETSGLARRHADQAAHDFRGVSEATCVHVLQRRSLGLMDALLRLSRSCGKVALERGALRRHLVFQLVVRFLRDGMRPCLGLGERLLVGGDGLLRLAPELVCRLDVAGDPRVPRLDHAADPGNATRFIST